MSEVHPVVVCLYAIVCATRLDEIKNCFESHPPTLIIVCNRLCSYSVGISLGLVSRLPCSSLFVPLFLSSSPFHLVSSRHSRRKNAKNPCTSPKRRDPARILCLIFVSFFFFSILFVLSLDSASVWISVSFCFLIRA